MHSFDDAIIVLLEAIEAREKVRELLLHLLGPIGPRAD